MSDVSGRSAEAIGVDLGGSNLRIVRTTVDGTLVDSASGPVPQDQNADALIAEIARQVQQMVGDATVLGMGFAIAGTVFGEDETRQNMTNVPALVGVPIAARMEQATGLRCLVENDCRAALRGETHFGAARGFENVLCISLGTGVGSALLLDGRIRKGAHSNGGELGLTRVGVPGASDNPVLEDLASGRGLRNLTGRKFRELRAAADEGDGEAQKHLRHMCDALGMAIANVHLVVDVERVILVGGLTAMGEPLRLALQEAFERQCQSEYHLALEVGFGELGPWAGAIGAAAIMFEDAGLRPSLNQ